MTELTYPGAASRSSEVTTVATYTLTADVSYRHDDKQESFAIWSYYTMEDREPHSAETVKTRVTMALLAGELLAQQDAQRIANQLGTRISLTVTWRDVERVVIVTATPYKEPK